ncbi:MAG TPA: asparagine synthase-related protein [Bryobacteraceae bacterium]|nr:asparagine synthase-related protein [Bryobacteraceae bacterium]
MTRLATALGKALETVPAQGPVAVALSGGLDSWVLALLLRERGTAVRGYTLRSDVAGYCEWPQTQALAGQFGMPLEAIRVGPGAFAEALPRFLAVTKTPIYNLHPVSKLLLAEALAQRGETMAVTGDGADQVFRCDRDCDLFPLTQACFLHAGVRLHTPFLSAAVRALCVEPDSEKRPVRELAALLGIPAIPKRPTLYPGGDILNETRKILEGMACAASRG